MGKADYNEHWKRLFDKIIAIVTKGNPKWAAHTITAAPAGSIGWIRQSQAKAGRDSKSIKSENT